ncbi:MAG TPA: TonB-dependent receptor [Bacteroidales bacterium]|nr:TonB-dependent receptor [Bacteroidales bacterium]
MIRHSKYFFTTLFFFCLVLFTYGQGSTTSSMSGKIIDERNQPMAGATVVATHVPSGTVYGATTNSQGLYTLDGMRPGGPYKVEISFVGYARRTFTDITLLLGENSVLNADLSQESTELREVTVVGTKTSMFNTEKTGATTNIKREDMLMVPTMNRTLGDYTRLSPYSTGTGSYVGRNAYNTNVTVDGANFNNNFGLSGTNMPGVSGEPISMESIEEIQVAVSPFDVRQSNFTGAGVNAITKSGTNQFRGSVYGYYRDQSFNGTKIRDTKLTVAESAKKAYGFTLGGPIIKNKLFFFLSGEKESTLTPGNTLLALDDGRDPETDLNVSSRVYADSLVRFSQLLKDNFGYETGRYEDWGGDDEMNNKMLVKLNWNISRNHKLTLRYNFSESSNVSRPSNSGDARPSISNGRHSRTGGMSFENSQYFNSNKLHSVTAELNSRFGQLSNKFLLAYTNYKQPRASNSTDFPFIDIMSGDATKGDVMMSAGYELFSYKNRVDNNTLILTDNVSYQLDKHNLTFGLSYESQYFANSYLRQGSAYYRFKNLASFENFLNGEGDGLPYNDNYHPINFAYTYPINNFTNPVAELSFGQFSSYLQDEFSVLSNLKIMGGLRLDLPMYLDGALDNPSLHGKTFAGGEAVDLSTWPDAKILWSPRLGFSWDVLGNKTLKVRGGTGIFTGRIPFVWFTNQPTNSGMIQYQLVINSSGGATSRGQLARLPLLADASQLLKDGTLSDIFPQSNIPGGRIAAIDKNFKLPQVWRTSLGFDIKLPLEMMLTLEGVYTNDLNSITFENINLQPAAGTYLVGDQTMPYWSNNTNATKYITQPYTDVVIMRNTDLGQGYSLSAQLTLPQIYGLSGMIGYSRSWSEEIAGKSGSDPFSAWQYRVITRELNSRELGLSMNNTPHRVVATLSYNIEYAKVLGSSISFFYNGYIGDAFSYIYNGDANKDGTSSHELMYIPENPTDYLWASPEDEAAYFVYASQDPYLKKHKGGFAQRYGAYEPWYGRLDMRFMQEIKIKTGEQVNKLQFSVDVINFMNLLNSSWGLDQSLITTSPLSVTGRDATTGRMIVSMRKIGGKYVSESFQDPNSVAGTWGIQLGLKYLFN